MLFRSDAEDVATKGFEKPKRAKRGFLHNIFGVVIVTHKESGQVVCGVEMRQNLPLELA